MTIAATWVATIQPEKSRVLKRIPSSRWDPNQLSFNGITVANRDALLFHQGPYCGQAGPTAPDAEECLSSGLSCHGLAERRGSSLWTDNWPQDEIYGAEEKEKGKNFNLGYGRAPLFSEITIRAKSLSSSIQGKFRDQS